MSVIELTREKLDRWVRMLRNVAESRRLSAGMFDEFAEPELIDGHRAAARDFDELAEWLEQQSLRERPLVQPEPRLRAE